MSTLFALARWCAATVLTALLTAGCSTLPATDDPSATPVDGGPPVPVATAVATGITPPAGPPTAASAALAGPAQAAALTAIAQPTEPGAPRGRLDPAQDAERGDLWARVRDGFALPDLDDELVRKWERHYAGQPDYVQRMVARGSRYLFHIVEEVEKRGMPAELALLPFIESAFNPQAQSRAKASGMWQFMPATGRDFELRQNLFRDDRRSVLASTSAALDYLQRLHAQFGDWHLALAAYNWGQGNVQRAIQRNERAHKPTTYAALRMPAETRNYVPKLQAVKNIVARPEAFALQLPALQDHPYFVGVTIERDIDVDRLAALAGLPLEEFQWLNPQLNKPVILAAGTPQVLLPYDHANRFLQALPQAGEPLASWTAWVAPRTLKPADAARLVGVSEAELRDINQIPARMLVKAGSTLVVPRGAHVTDDVAGHIADTAMMTLAPEGRPARRVAFKAGRQGDTVVAVARRYGVSAAQVKSWNRPTAQGRFAPGQMVVVMLDAPARRALAVPAQRTAKAKASKGKAAASVRSRTKPAARVAQR